MRRFKLFSILIMVAGLVLALSACGSADEDNNAGEDNASNGDSADFTVGMATDEGSVFDKSFNQLTWEGIEEWGEENGLSKGEGINYIEADSQADYVPNLKNLVRNDFDLIVGVGYKLEEAVSDVAENNPDGQFAIIDTVVDGDNVASIVFKGEESAFLVGVAAAMKTKTDKVGFVGGVDVPLIQTMEAGFTAGVKSVDPNIEVMAAYAGGFDAPDKGKSIAANMYSNDADIVYHAAGGTGNGVFNQAKDLKKNNPDREIWVIGQDKDQYEDGMVDDMSITLTSMIKRLDVAVQDVINESVDGNFPGGEVINLGLAEDGVGYTKTNEDALTDDMIAEMDKWKEKIINDDIDVPQTPDELEEFIDNL